MTPGERSEVGPLNTLRAVGPGQHAVGGAAQGLRRVGGLLALDQEHGAAWRFGELLEAVERLFAGGPALGNPAFAVPGPGSHGFAFGGFIPGAQVHQPPRLVAVLPDFRWLTIAGVVA